MVAPVGAWGSSIRGRCGEGGILKGSENVLNYQRADHVLSKVYEHVFL